MENEREHFRSRLSQLAQQAQLHLAQEDPAAAHTLVAEGFSLADAQGLSQDDAVFIALLLVAGDVAICIGETESAAGLYLRAQELCHALSPVHASTASPSMLALHARAWLSLARADVYRGYRDRARERYANALALFESMETSSSPHDLVSEASRGARGEFD